MTESAVDHTPLRDLYVALGEPIDKSNANGDWAVRLYYKPMMRLVWGGALLMALGGLLAVTARRYRLARGPVAARTGSEAAIGRAAWRERVVPSWSFPVVAVSLKKKPNIH